jgi:hypothetical protein
MSHLNAFENLDDLLDAAVLENLCCKWGCTTCGAGFFRQKIADFLAGLKLATASGKGAIC